MQTVCLPLHPNFSLFGKSSRPYKGGEYQANGTTGNTDSMPIYFLPFVSLS